MKLLRLLITGGAMACLALPIPAMADATHKVNCTAQGDSLTVTATGEGILEQRLVNFTPLKSLGSWGDEAGICIIKSDPPGRKWLRCDKEKGKYLVYTRGRSEPFLVKPEKAVSNSAQYRGWSGACLVKL